jgi:hypothetical protein
MEAVKPTVRLCTETWYLNCMLTVNVLGISTRLHDLYRAQPNTGESVAVVVFSDGAFVKKTICNTNNDDIINLFDSINCNDDC